MNLHKVWPNTLKSTGNPQHHSHLRSELPLWEDKINKPPLSVKQVTTSVTSARRAALRTQFLVLLMPTRYNNALIKFQAWLSNWKIYLAMKRYLSDSSYRADEQVRCSLPVCKLQHDLWLWETSQCCFSFLGNESLSALLLLFNRLTTCICMLCTSVQGSMSKHKMKSTMLLRLWEEAGVPR